MAKLRDPDFATEAAVIGQKRGRQSQRAAERTTYRNRHRERRFNTPAGDAQAEQVPKLREGGYVPSFIEHRKRS